MMTGKPYSGKSNARFDEGELEIEPPATTPAPYSTLLACFALFFGPWSKFHLKKSG